MQVSVKLFGPQAQSVGERAVCIELPGAAPTCADVRRALATHYPQLAAMFAASRIAVNHQFAEDSAPVQAGDEVAVIGPVSGG